MSTEYGDFLDSELTTAFSTWRHSDPMSEDVALMRMINAAKDKLLWYKLYHADLPLEDIKEHLDNVRKYRAVE